MKLSLKLQDHQKKQTTAATTTTTPTQPPLLLRAKIPITVFGLPFLSSFSATDHLSAPSISLRTNFPSAPSLQLSYNPSNTAGTATNPDGPLTLTLKSGVGLYGSPINSPLTISAHFSFSPTNPNPTPTFSLQFKPRIGSFSLRKTTVSNPNPNPKKKLNGDISSFGFVPLGDLKDLAMDSSGFVNDSIFSGILVMARTELPVTKRLAVNLRWGVNVPGDHGKQLPYLRVNKIGIERSDMDEMKDEKVVKEKESGSGELEMLKGMCSWMRSELDGLRTENREIKNRLEEVRLGNLVRNNRLDEVRLGNHHGNGSYGGSGGGKKSVPIVEKGCGSGFEEWSKKNGVVREENGRKELKKNGNLMDVESELQRAIMAVSS